MPITLVECDNALAGISDPSCSPGVEIVKTIPSVISTFNDGLVP